jgi:hypothetical protein
MAVDNTSVFKTQLIERVQEGMHVFDADGVDIGAVQSLKMGDPEAVTTAGNEPTVSAGYVPLTSDADEPDVPEPLRSDLLRVGYIKIDGRDLFDHDRYVRADVLERIDGDKVYLRLPKSRLAAEDRGDANDVMPSHRVPAGDRRIVMPPPAAGLGLPNSGTNL